MPSLIDKAKSQGYLGGGKVGDLTVPSQGYRSAFGGDETSAPASPGLAAVQRNLVGDGEENTSLLKSFGKRVGETQKRVFSDIKDAAAQQLTPEGVATGGGLLGGAQKLKLRLFGAVGKGINDFSADVVDKVVEHLPEAVKSPVRNLFEGWSQTEAGQKALSTVKDAGEAWDKFSEAHPEQARDISDVVNSGNALLNLEGGKAVGDLAAKLPGAAKGAVKGVGEAAAKATGAAGELVKPGATLDETLARVAQRKGGLEPKELRDYGKALGDLSTENIKTYQDLGTATDKRIKQLARQQDAILEDTTPAKLGTFERNVAGTKINYVKTAIADLTELYTKTADAEGLAYVKQLSKKAAKEGLTVKEVNDLARKYGSEIGSKAFGKNGEALTSVNAQKYENIRKGVKETARDFMPDDASKMLDQQMSRLFDVQADAQRMTERVNTLTQKMEKANVFQKIAQKLGGLVDMVTLGSPKAFAMKLLGLDAKLGEMNAVQIEQQLQKNLKLIERLSKEEGDAFVDDVVNEARIKFAGPGAASKYEPMPNEPLPKGEAPAAGASVAPFTGFEDVSTTILDKLEGRKTVSKQFISDLTNSGELRQSERDLIRRVLEGEPETVNVKEFAEKIKDELLPLDTELNSRGGEGQYEHVVLPDDLRGDVQDYYENIYQSPVETSAGKVHFGGSDIDNEGGRYFAHTRIEDMPGDTRRVIELQSDLFQKGRLDTAVMDGLPGGSGAYTNAEIDAQISKLKPYENTWHERIIREEVKKAAEDGKKEVLFPTGETAMKVEGLGESRPWGIVEEGVHPYSRQQVTPETLKVGQVLANDIVGDEVVVTEVLGDGKFKAVPKRVTEGLEMRGYDSKGFSDVPKSELEGWEESFDISGKIDKENPIYKFYEKDVGKFLNKNFGATRIKDGKGVEWWKVLITPDMKAKPVKAFGMKEKETNYA